VQNTIIYIFLLHAQSVFNSVLCHILNSIHCHVVDHEFFIKFDITNFNDSSVFFFV